MQEYLIALVGRDGHEWRPILDPDCDPVDPFTDAIGREFDNAFDAPLLTLKKPHDRPGRLADRLAFRPGAEPELDAAGARDNGAQGHVIERNVPFDGLLPGVNVGIADPE